MIALKNFLVKSKAFLSKEQSRQLDLFQKKFVSAICDTPLSFLRYSLINSVKYIVTATQHAIAGRATSGSK